MIFGAKTDIGKVREINEDCYGCVGNLFVIADGMGGHQAGEVASSIAVETVLASAGDITNEDDLQRVIMKANEAILKEVTQKPELAGMGTTIALLMLQSDDEAWVAHVGDSRVYQLSRDQVFLRLTNDHSLVAELIRKGELTEAEAKNHPQRNMLTQALGTKGKINIEIGRVTVKPGDKFLLCTDGLTGMLPEKEIQTVMLQEIPPQDLADQLVQMANGNGGNDNTTVIVIDTAATG